VTAVVAALLLGVVAWMLRVWFVAVVPAERLPESFRDALPFVAPAVLGSLVAVGLVGTVRGSDPGAALVLVGGLGVAGLAARRTGSLALAVAIGALATLVVDVVLT
jgi:branched-subunit amino acid transport protein